MKDLGAMTALQQTGAIPLLAAVGVAALLSCSAGGGTGSAAVVGEGGDDAQDVSFGDGNLLPGGGLDFGDDVASSGFDGDFTGVPECEACEDFPREPIFEDGLGPDVVSVFAQSPSGAGPCIVEPPEGMLIPANMLRPRVRFTGQGSLHQITLSTPREVNDLVVYTTKNPWIVPPEVWQGLGRNVFEEDVTVTVRTTTGNAAPSESRSSFRIAPVQAGGSMIYWGATTRFRPWAGARAPALVLHGHGEHLP
jgi:hypothetical protein